MEKLLAWSKKASMATILLLLATFNDLAAADGAGLKTVKDYGAVGDGATDDTAAFRQALSSTKMVSVPKGRYRLTGDLRLPAGGGLTGPGTLNLDFGDALGSWGIYVEGNNVRIEGITLEKKFFDGSYCTGIVADHRKNLVIHNVQISGFSARYGIHIIESTQFEISNCYIHDFMMNTAADMIEDSPAGIRVTRSLRGVIANNRLERIEVGPIGRDSISPRRPAYGKQGYQSDHMTIMQCRDIAITGNQLLTSGEGIDMLFSESCTITGNVIRDIFFEGVKMLGTSYCTLNTNHISDCFIGIGLDDGSMNGTRVPCLGNTVEGNVVRDSGSPGSFGIPGPGRVPTSGPYGIKVGDNSDFNAITGNVILDTQVTKTTVTGLATNSKPHNILANNLVSTDLTHVSQVPYSPVSSGATKAWLALESL